MPGRRTLPVVALACLAFAASACSSDDAAVRIGVLSDCQGPFKGFRDAQLSGAELPFLRRGARLLGTGPSGGVTAIRVNGRRVELVHGCLETGEHTVYIEEARRLLETERVDVLVGGASVVARELAHRYPDVAFVSTLWDDPEITLRRPATNLFRFSPDFAQQTAGLGTYAFRTLGWRRAAVVAGDGTPGWAGAAAFTAEFCALGGTVVEESYRSPFVPDPTLVPRTLETSPDGVAAFLSFVDSPAEVLGSLAAELEDPARQLLIWSATLEDAQVVGALGPKLRGVVGTTWLPSGAPSRALRDYRDRYRSVYPGVPPSLADQSAVIGFHNALEATLTALERVEGSDIRSGVLSELGRLRLQLPDGVVALDRNRQAVRDVYLSRIASTSGSTRLTPVGTVPSVEQTYGGLLSGAPPPGPSTQPCRRATPPPWAR
jgi:branched-chain amino acid transport system substrate-binding protein